MTNRLFLIPTPISEQAQPGTLPELVRAVVGPLRFFIVEEERTARRFLRKILPSFPIDDCRFFVFNEHNKASDAETILQQANAGDVGILSEAGLPCVADPGHEIVRAAHKLGMTVVPLPGISSIFMALMASGLNGQNFAFHGYLPVKKEDKMKKLAQLVSRSASEKQTQIVMDAPYRNNAMLDDLLESLPPNSQLCIASELTSPGEYIKTATVSEWRKMKPDLNKKPALFLFQVNG